MGVPMRRLWPKTELDVIRSWYLMLHLMTRDIQIGLNPPLFYNFNQSSLIYVCFMKVLLYYVSIIPFKSPLILAVPPHIASHTPPFPFIFPTLSSCICPPANPFILFYYIFFSQRRRSMSPQSLILYLTSIVLQIRNWFTIYITANININKYI